MKVLVTGGSGLVGKKLVNILKNNNEVLTAFNKNPVTSKEFESVKMDITNEQNVKNMIKRFGPDVIFHTAALTDVDYCEDHREEAARVNIDGTRNIVEASKETGSKILFISTDYVFDGRNGPYSETDVPNPINFHGYTKLEGEKLVLQNNQNIVARTTIVFGWNPKGKQNFVNFIINMLSSGKVVRIVTDQYGTPTLADFCADVLVKLAEKNKKGIYNVVGKDYINRYDFALKIAENFDLDFSLIQRTTSEELRQKAPRPKKAGLKVEKIERELNVNALGIEESLKIMKEQKGVGIG